MIRLVLTGLLCFVSVAAGAPIPKGAENFLVNYCLNCHDADSEKGDLDLDFTEIDWNDSTAIKTWTRVYDALDAGEMPPKKKKQPAVAERKAMIAWLDGALSRFARPGGTVLRRLNRSEYERSVRAALGVPFEAGRGFPDDPKHHGFDNQGEGLILSPPVLQQYFTLAGQAADFLIPPAKLDSSIAPVTISCPPNTMSMNFEASQLRGEVMRLVTNTDILIRSCSWPTRFEAKRTGTYEIRTQLSAFKPKPNDPPLKVELIQITSSMTFTGLAPRPRLATFEVPADGKLHTFTATFDLEAGQNVAFYWANAPMGMKKNANRSEVDKWISALFREDPRLYAAWREIGGYNRQRTPKKGWALMKRAMADSTLKVSETTPTRFGTTTRNQLNWILQNRAMELGPALNVHGSTFRGPTVVKESTDEKKQRERTEAFLGERKGRGDAEFATGILKPILDKAFRRPVSHAQVQQYVDLALSHQQAGHRFEDGIHLALRSALCSVHFLYRGHRAGTLDDYDLASRLSYFLTGGPPDARLARLAAAGKLSDPDVLEKTTRRMLAAKRGVSDFLVPFVTQWLGLDALEDIMPDERLIKWSDKHTQAILRETHLFAEEMLRRNHPLEEFIDPDFTYVNKHVAPLYGMKSGSEALKRVKISRGGRHGGILGQASILMATANGVDTQPVLRGVWLLENIFGDSPPEPPAGVPAIEPDTSGAKSMRELMARHTADPNCAGCHLKIDPLGFALENFDPVGRWRETYPVYVKNDGGKVMTKAGLPVDAASQLADGTPLKNVTDLKRYLVDNIDVFSSCLAGKLLTYATGRTPGFAEGKEIERLVQEVRANRNGFADLIVAIVLSESFRVK